MSRPGTRAMTASRSSGMSETFVAAEVDVVDSMV